MKIHILAIVGQLNTPLALALQKQGHEITGSDQEQVYPPFSTLLEQAKIPLNQPLGQPDLVIVGAPYKYFSRCLKEFEQIKKMGIPYISATEYLAQNLVRKNSILVAGSHGKTTISAILAHNLPAASYFYGGQSADLRPSLQFTDSDWSVCEADENANGLDTQAKFLYYPVKYLILTSARWEHKETYPTAADNLKAYQKLIQRVPADGVIVYNPKDPDIKKIIGSAKCQTIPYQLQTWKTKLIGAHNHQNISAAATLCRHLKLPFKIEDFAGIRRRLEIVSDKNNILIIDDFAQSAERVLSALTAVRETYPGRRIYVYFEAHATFLQNKISLTGFHQIGPLVEKFILARLKYSPDKTIRTTATHWQDRLGDRLRYLPLNNDIVAYFKNQLKSGDILIHFSSGGLEGLETLKKVYN